MFTAFLIIGLVILLTAFVASCIIIQRLLKKIDLYEEWILDFKTDLIATVERMREIDKSVVFSNKVNEEGAFESDDQVGGVFKELLALVEKLNQRTQ